MIKKSVFEDDLINGMHYELILQAHNAEGQDLSTAVDHLNSAAQILEEVGMINASDRVLNILLKLADTSQKVISKGFPAMQVFLDAGLTTDDLKNMSSNIVIRARVINIMRSLGYTDENIIKLMGEKNFIPHKKVQQILLSQRHPSRLPKQNIRRDMDLFQSMQAGDPIATAKINAALRNAGKNDAEIIEAVGFKNFMTEREIKRHLATSAMDIIPQSYKGNLSTPEIIEQLEPDDIEIVANKKINDRHTKGLTSEKMLNNLKHHGTMFNLADDGLLDHEIDNNNLEVSENDLLSEYNDFEDEID